MKPFKTEVIISDITFTGTLTPAEPEVRYYKDGSGNPGSPAEFDIESIEGDHMILVEMIDGIISNNNGKKPIPKLNIWEALESKCLEKMGDDYEAPEPMERD